MRSPLIWHGITFSFIFDRKTISKLRFILSFIFQRFLHWPRLIFLFNSCFCLPFANDGFDVSRFMSRSPLQFIFFNIYVSYW